MSKYLVIAVALICIAIGVGIGYAISRPSVTTVTKTFTSVTTVTTTSPTTATVVQTETQITTYTTTRVRTPTPRLLFRDVIARQSELPPSTFISVYSWWHHAPQTPIVFAPNSQYFAIGLAKFVEGKAVGVVRVYSVDGKVLLNVELGSLSYPYSLAWSESSRYLVVGEQCVEAKILVYDVNEKKLVWSYDVSQDIGKGDPKASRWKWPTVYYVEVRNGVVYAVACRSIPKPYTKICKVYAFDLKSGKLLWKAPSEGYIDTCVPYFKVSPDGKYLAGVTWYYVGEKWRGGTLFLIDTSSGKIVKTFYPGLRPPFRRAGSWKGLTWLDDEHIAYVLDDGRLYILSVPDLEVVYSTNVTTPMPALVIPRKSTNTTQGYVYAYAGYAYAVRFSSYTILIVRTSNTYGLTAAGKSATPTINHPDALSLFIYLWKNGKLTFLAKYPLRGRPCYYQNFLTSSNNGLLAVPVGHDWIARTYVYHGVYIYNLSDVNAVKEGKAEVYVVKPPLSEGVVISGAISPNGKYVVVVTYPINVGTYKQPKYVGDYIVELYELPR